MRTIKVSVVALLLAGLGACAVEGVGYDGDVGVGVAMSAITTSPAAADMAAGDAAIASDLRAGGIGARTFGTVDTQPRA